MGISCASFGRLRIPMDNKLTYDDWVDFNYDSINEVYNKVASYLQNEVDLYSPLYNMYVEHDGLFEDIAKHMYVTSNNAYKHYCMR